MNRDVAHAQYCIRRVVSLSALHLLAAVVLYTCFKIGNLFFDVIKMRDWIFILSVLILVVIKSSSGLYFHIGETERKCFIEEIPDETTVIGM